MATSNVPSCVEQVEHPHLKKLASGKVRELFIVDDDTLLFVATDRISAYDVIMKNWAKSPTDLAKGIPSKGAILTQLSAFWFELISQQLPGMKTHLVSLELPASIGAADDAQFQNRSMLVKRYPIVKLESIVRGYITGSAWAEYRKHGTVHGTPMPAGLQESQKFEKPIWTPSTKAEAGEHDENISREQAAKIVGEDVARKVEEASLKIYELASEYAAARGIIIADTKFEFGLDPQTGEVVLVDEVLTPDSSRFWPANEYQIGKSQSSYDKQFLRDWLTSTGNKGKPGVSMPPEIADATRAKYLEAFEKLTGKHWS